jgi:23S rRNA pseudouridine2457 synthase
MYYKYLAIYKPFNVLSQFTSNEENLTLVNIFIFPPEVYPIGRLDYDSEGLLILTNDNYLKSQLLEPKNYHRKTYFVQVEGIPNQTDLDKLRAGVEININGSKHQTRPAQVEIIKEPHLPDRNPPIRFRASIPTSWLSVTISEGKNRQVRKMTAKIGFPTLRLVRYGIENLTLEKIQLDKINEFTQQEIYKLTGVK